MSATCSSCPFYEPGINGKSYCHHSTSDVCVASDDWWCSEHPFHPSRVHALAAMAMPSVIAETFAAVGPDVDANLISRDAYRVARAMLHEAEREGQ